MAPRGISGINGTEISEEKIAGKLKLLCGLPATYHMTKSRPDINRHKIYSMMYIRVPSIHCTLPMRYISQETYQYNLPAQADDVIVAGYPGSGEGVVCSLVKTLMNQWKTSQDLPISPIYDERIHLMEARCILRETDEMKKIMNTVVGTDTSLHLLDTPKAYQPRHKVFRTNLPKSLMKKSLLKKCQMIYVVREPKDVLYSNYCWSKRLKYLSFHGTFKDYVRSYVNGDALFGTQRDHVLSWWELSSAEEDKTLYVSYDVLKKKPDAQIRRINDFLGLGLTNEELETITSDFKFDEVAALVDIVGENVTSAFAPYQSEFANFLHTGNSKRSLKEFERKNKDELKQLIEMHSDMATFIV